MIEISGALNEIAADLAELPDALDAEMGRATALSTQMVTAKARQTDRFEDRSGVLRNSIVGASPHGRFTAGTLEGIVSAGAPHARAIEFGSKPHVIRPRHRRALRIPMEGGFRFLRGVRHPGIAARAFLARALEESIPDIETVFGDHLELALRRTGFR